MTHIGKYTGEFKDLFDEIRANFDFDKIHGTRVFVCFGSDLNTYERGFGEHCEYRKGIYENVSFDPDTEYKVWQYEEDVPHHAIVLVYVEPFELNKKVNETMFDLKELSIDIELEMGQLEVIYNVPKKK